jgi:hypothetical protein
MNIEVGYLTSMASKTLVSLLVLAGLSNGQYDRYGPIRKNITWTSCVTVSAPPGFLCGEFDVPLDYTDVTRGKATLALIKYPSTVQPRKGTIFLNPGEGERLGFSEYLPDRVHSRRTGGSRLGLLDQLWRGLVQFEWCVDQESCLSLHCLNHIMATGGQYDISGSYSFFFLSLLRRHSSIVSWDPRGVGLSYPRIRCFNSTAEQASFWQGTAPSQLSSDLPDSTPAPLIFSI